MYWYRMEVIIMLTTKEISEMLKVSEETVRRWIRTGDLKAIQEGKGYLVEKKDLMKLVQEKSTATNSSIGKMATLIPLIGGVGAIAGETIFKMLTKKNLDALDKNRKGDISLQDITYRIEELKLKKKKIELEHQMELLEIEEEISVYQKLQNQLKKSET